MACTVVTESQVFYKCGPVQPGFLMVQNTHTLQMWEEDPDSVQCHREEVVEEFKSKMGSGAILVIFSINKCYQKPGKQSP